MNNKEFEKYLVDSGLAALAADGNYAFNVSNKDLGTMLPYRNTGLTKAVVSVSSTAKKILGWNIVNPNAYAVYVKLYTHALVDVNVLTTEPSMIITVPGGTADNPGIIYQEPNCKQHDIVGLKIRACKGIELANNVDAAVAPYVELKYSNT